MPTPTKKQKEILDFITSYINKRGISPTIEETAKYFKRAVGTIHEHIEELVEKGLIKKNNNSSRGIELNVQSEMVRIPLLGIIAAGQPLKAVEEKEIIAIPKEKLPRSGNIFALKVAGDSMIEEDINDGDYVIVKQQATAENGQKVVALIDNDEATLKKFYKEKNRIRLQPANQTMLPLFFEKSRVAIQGIITDIIRGAPSEITRPDDEDPKKNLPSKLKEWINTIQCMDCVKGMEQLPDNSLDLILTDPPYGISRNLNCKNQRLGTTAKLNFNFGEWDQFNKKWFDIAVKKTRGWIVTFCAKKDVGFYWDILEKNDFKAIDVIVWQKPDPIPLNGKTKFLNAWESAVIGKKPGAIFNGRCQHNILKYQAPKGKNRIHPTQKPENLMKEIISLTTKKGDIVLDPFMGSGTTAAACLASGRNFVGFEIDKKYTQQALLRIKNMPRL